MNPSDEDEQGHGRYISILKTTAQLAVGLAGGWFTGIAVFYAGLIVLSIPDFRLTTIDILCMIGMALWIAVAWLTVVAVHRYQRFWLPLFVAFALSTSVFAMFAIFLAIPFGASMRDFD